jgi:mannose-6-phosphate isomerase-like protein (cupin superfamily)
MPKGLVTALLLALQTQAQTTLPANYTTILENQTFRIIRVHYGPHEKVPVHDHPDIPTVFVYLNDSGPINIIHEEPDGTHSTVVRPPTHTGAFRVGPGLFERHSIENPGDLPSDFLRVELPAARAADKIVEFRGPAPADLTHNLTATEFSSPQLTITRILCADQTPCIAPPTSAPSVIVAFSNSTVSVAGKSTPLEANNVLAIPPNQPLQISRAGPAPANILQIAFAAHSSATP